MSDKPIKAVGHQEELESLVHSWVRSYDGLFKVPVLQAPRFDGTRDVSTAFQTGIDTIIDQLLVRFGVRCHRLDPARRPWWIDEVLDRMDLPGKPAQFDLFDGGS